jgi:hypothetical protein
LKSFQIDARITLQEPVWEDIMRFPRRKFLQLAAGAALPAALATVALLVPTSGILLGSSAADCSASNCGAGQAMPFRQGPYFNHALPAGWLVMEENNTMLLLQSRDRSADISVAGIGGLKQQLTPEVFAYQRMVALRLTDVRFSSVVYIIPMAAYDGAAVMDVTYTAPIGRMRGLVVSNVATVYNRNVFDRTDGVMALVGAKESIWDAYSNWLPEVALQAMHTGPNPFDAPRREAERANQMVTTHRDWAKRTWDELVAYRSKTQAGQDAAPGMPRGALPAGQQLYDNPYGGAPIRQSAGPAAIWINRNGQQLPTDDPSFDPRIPTDPEWQRLIPKRP